MTGISRLFADWTAVEIADESTGLINNASTPFCIRSSTSLFCLAESFCASITRISTPCLFASAVTPSLRATKKGLFRVERDKPIFKFCPLPSLLGLAHSGGSREQPVISSSSMDVRTKVIFFIIESPFYAAFLRSISTAIAMTIPLTTIW